MKIGIISDIHGNIEALNEVLKKFDELKVDMIICSGDIIGIGVNPEEVVKALMKRQDILVAVRGNHEKYLLEGIPKEIHDDKRKLSYDEIKNHEWTHSRLSENSKKFLSKLPVEKMLQIEGKKIYIVHYPMDEKGKYIKHIKKPTEEESMKMFEGIDADVFVYGHTHEPSINIKDGKLYINPGSLGCPNKSNIANSVLLEINESEIEFKQLKIEYDVDYVIEKIKKEKYPFYNKILEIFYGE